MENNYCFKNCVKFEILNEIKRRVSPGSPVTQQDLYIAYRIVRASAIADTLFWKRMFITIERI